MDNYILAGDERQAALDAAKAAFLSQGGEINVLDSFVYQPLPNRKHPEPKPKTPRSNAKPVSARQLKDKEKVEMVAEMAKTMTCSDAARELRVSQEFLWNMAKRNGFTFVLASRGRTIQKTYDDAKVAALAERITALRDIGVSRNQATIPLQIGHTTMKRIIQKFDIVFPPSGLGNKK